MAMIGEGICVVKTLTRNHLYCEPPSEQPAPRHRTKREGTDLLPEFTVGNRQYRKKCCLLKRVVEVEAGSWLGSGRRAEALVGYERYQVWQGAALGPNKRCLEANDLMIHFLKAGFGSSAGGRLCWRAACHP